MEVGIGKWNTCVWELLYWRQVIPDWTKGLGWAHNINSSCRFRSSWQAARGKAGGEERRRCQRSSRRSGSLYLCWCFVQFLTRQSLLCWYCSLFSRYYFPWCWYWIFFLVSFLYGADTVDPHFIKCQSLVSYILLVLLPIFLSILFHVLFTACGKVLWSHKYCLSHLNYTKISRAFVVKNRLKANCNHDVFF